jgi:hypothetical protein
MITTVPPRPEVSFGAVLSASWTLFARNPTIALPSVLGALAVAALFVVYVVVLIAMLGIAGWQAVLESPHADSSVLLPVGIVAAIGWCVLMVAGIVIAIWTVCATYGMADAAWARGTATLADGNAAFRARAGAVFVAGIGIFGLFIVAIVLALPTLTLSIFALALLMFFVMPAAVGGRREGFDAIAESFRLIRRFFVPSLVMWLIVYAIQYGVSLLMTFSILPLEFSIMPSHLDATGTVPPQFNVPPLPLVGFSGVGSLVSSVLLLAYNGFRATVEVGLFRALESQPPA